MFPHIDVLSTCVGALDGSCQGMPMEVRGPTGPPPHTGNWPPPTGMEPGRGGRQPALCPLETVKKPCLVAWPMCRMVAARGLAQLRRQALVRLRTQSRTGTTGPPRLRTHPDGWGIVAPSAHGPIHVGRSIRDAAYDPGFDVAVRRASEAPEGWILGHTRNASEGGRTPQNTHPFVREGWAFCHNGTLFDYRPATERQTWGDTDSERFFLELLDSISTAPTPQQGIMKTIRRIDAKTRYESLTFLLTNGDDLFAFRRTGATPGECGTMTCALEHFGLSWSSEGANTLVFQEPWRESEPVGSVQEIPDGSLLIVQGGAPPRLEQVVPARSALLAPE